MMVLFRGVLSSAAVLAVSLGLVVAQGLAIDDPPEWNYRAWRAEEGLPDNSVTGIAQTPDGFLWVATRAGLLRFNGVEFMEIPLPSLPIFNRVMRVIHLDRSGRLWVGLERGQVMCLDPQGNQTYGMDEGLPSAPVQSMAEDHDGAMWVAFSNEIVQIKDGKCKSFGPDEGISGGGGSCRVAGNERGDVWYSHGGEIGVCRDGGLEGKLALNERNVEMCAAASSGLWFCAGSRILRYHERQEPEEVVRIPGNVVPRVLFEDHSGVLWIGTASEGLFRYEAGLLEKVPTSHQDVVCLSEDREGNIWAGTAGGGLNLVRPRALVLMGQESGLPSESLRSVCEDAEGNHWVVMQNGLLATTVDGHWSQIEDNTGWSGGDANCVAADRDGGVWVGTRNNGLHHFKDGKWRVWDRSHGFAGSSVRSVLAASDGSVWIATDYPRKLHQIAAGKIITIGMPKEIPAVRSIRAMVEGEDGTIWIGTAGGEVMRVRGRSLVIEAAVAEAQLHSVRSLHATPDGALWIGYAGEGLGRLKDGNYVNITTSAGLMDNYVSQIVSDGSGGLWIAGNHGLFQIAISDFADVAEGRATWLRSRVFGRAEGLVGLQPSFDYSPTVCRGRDGRLWFAMRNGLLMVRPDKIRDNPEPPPVVLERVSVDDRTVALYDKAFEVIVPGENPLPELRSPTSPLLLEPGHNKLEFEFAALSFASPENVHYRYRLENFDKKWIEADSLHRASYPRLSAGKYQFHVIACNNAGVWNGKGASLNVVVEPFYWQTWWFRGLAVTFFTASVISIVRYLSFRRLRAKMQRLKQQDALHRERARIARDMHDEVGSKLTRLSLLSDMFHAQPRLDPLVQSEVSEISDTARETILAFDEIVWAVNPRNDTLGDLAHYLCRHAEEFFEGSDTECLIDLPTVIPPSALSTEARHQVFLAAKEALNNVLKHAGASQVRLRLIQQPDAFELVIEDDGRGFDPTAPDPRAGGGNGLGNMRERMRGISGHFECRSKPGEGTRITFRVPSF